ncbi:hypothetical protein CDV36_013913 [Fusarium kuroshium]|uniref:Uncharacterized protein n=3 Tax=Fusarium solani species complex TaxID=232080 RepID=A0A3M2RMB9_9HYPO|nr:hypothetical protein CDV36_013913 [Fusarium kuroshium]RSL40883.1 hypothetical protein CEP51_016643 [Fusarium floridanum]RSM06833.1 hypothetical protein CDV31_008930 [Fusarium ambrosium]
MPTTRSRAATVSAAAGSNRRRGSFTADRTETHNLFDRHALDKRVSRDDLSLALKSSRKGNNITAFHVPIHGRPPSPDTSPRSSSLTRMTMVRTSTPDSIGDSSETGVIAIGMAIGSPTQVGEFTPIAAWNPQRANTAAAEIPEPAPEPVDDTQQKTRKWGIFRSKSKRAARPTQPQRSMTDTPNVSTTSLASGGTVHDHRKTPKHTPIVIRSQTEPVPNEPEVPPPPPIPADLKTPTDLKPLSPGKLTKDKPTGIERKPSKDSKKESSSGGIGRKMSLRALRGDSARRRAEKAAAAAPPPPSPPPVPPMPQLTASLLDIEIPSIKMERYSVMFNGVLQTQVAPSSASSLLARRHATLDRLQTIGDGAAEGQDDHSRQRRATSPQPSPTIVGAETSKPPPSPRNRAHTSPALMSPGQASFQDEIQETAQARIVQVPKPSQNAPKLVSKFSVRRAASSPNRRNLTPTRGTSPVPLVSPTARSKAPSPFTPDTSSLILDSPAHTDEEAEAHFVRGHPQLSPSEPSWRMVSPPASITSSSPETSKKLSPPSSLASPDKITVIRPPENDPEEALRNAVEISIARQISVSHQQRKMLHPLKSNPSVRRRGDSNPMAPAGAYIPIEKNERLAETKTATPVLVHPRGELAHSPDTWQMHRKSERVILEGP